MFKAISNSRKKGIIKSNLNLFLISAALLVLVVCAVFIIISYLRAGSPLNLRYSTLEGPYDRGEWYRVFLVPVFMIFSFLASLKISSKLLSIDKPNFVSALLTTQLFIFLLFLVSCLQFLNYSQI